MVRATILIVMGLVIIVGCTPEAPSTKAPAAECGTRDRLSPAEKGVERARADIANGTMQILYYGKPWSADKPLIDDETGLSVKIVSGCCVTPEFTQETDAYNNTMRDARSKKKRNSEPRNQRDRQ